MMHFVTIGLRFQKAGRILIVEDSYRKQKYVQPLLEFPAIVTADAKSLFPAYSNKVGYRSVFGAILI